MRNALKTRLHRNLVKAETRRHELNYLFWECTTRCKLNCLHCGSDCSKDSAHPDMPLNDFLKALDTLREPSDNFTVVLSGGEPLLRKDLEECGKAIRRRGRTWGLVSNGMGYDEKRHLSLLSAGLGALTLSLDGLEDSHTWLRKDEASYTQVCKAIELAATSSHLNFDVVTCVNQRNLGQLEELYQVLLKKGLRAWRLFTILPIGRAADQEELILPGAAFRQLMEFIAHKRKEKQMDIKFSCEGYVGAYENRVRPGPYFCRAGINIASVLIDGSISACPNIDRSFVQGNIYQDNLQEVWDSKYALFRDRSWTRKGPCSNCKEYKDCQGNGFHNWHGRMQAPLRCHHKLISEALLDR